MKDTVSKKPIAALLVCYGSCVLIRFVLALITSAYPMINIDEFLYYGIARSLASGDGLMFRGQPANYCYILYPLMLTPVYWLGLEGHALFRALQLWNILLSSLSVFPLYFLSVRLLKQEKALRFACLAILLPDFMLGQLMMAENVIMPLFFSLMAVAAKYEGIGHEKDSGRWQDVVWAGLLGGLLFAAKPGTVIPAAVLLIYWCVNGIRTRSKARALWPIVGLAVTAATAGCFFLLLAVLGGTPSLLSIYNSQVADANHLNVFGRFLCLYPAYFCLAGGVGVVLLITANRKMYTKAQKALIRCVTLSLVATIIGVAWTVNRYEYNANTAHLRYIGMYLPLLLFFANVKAKEPVKVKKGQTPENNLPVIGVSALILALLLIPGVYGGTNKFSPFAENMTLATVIQAFRIGIPEWGYLLLAASLIGGSLLMVLRLDRDKAQRAVTILCCMCMVVNGLCAYRISATDTQKLRTSEAEQIWEWIDGSEPLYLYTQITTTSYYSAFDVYSPRDISFVSLNNLFNQMYASQGVYRPYIPDGQRGNNASRLTPDTDTLVMDCTVYCMVELSDNTEHKTVDENALHLVKIKDPEKPWLDSVIGNTINTTLTAGDTGILLLFKKAYFSKPMTFSMTLKCDSAATLNVFSNCESKVVQLEAGLNTYEITFDQPQDAYNMTCDRDIRFYDYSLSNP